jgi:2-haloacid dehalogenase
MRAPAEEARDGDGPAGVAGAPRAVLFDLGGVFIDWDPRHLYRKLFAGDAAAMEDFLANVCTSAWHEAQDRGKGIAEACAELAARHPAYAAFISAWEERNEEMVGGLLEGSIAVLAELKAQGVPCYALSNMERERWEWRLDNYEFLRWFDGYVISGLEGVAKPDREIFEIALGRFELAPAEVIFVDDRSLNVESAARLGIRSFLFTSPEAMRDVMVTAGLLRAGSAARGSR